MLNDLRAAIHFVIRRRGFSAVAALTLAMGIAANVTVFALVRSVLLTAEPYRSPHELFRIIPADHFAASPFEPGDIADLKRIPGITHVASCAAQAIPTARNRPVPLASVVEVSQDFFPLLGTDAYLGRSLLASDFDPGLRNAVISFELWEALLGRAPDVVGRRVQFNRQAFTVVGVMPPAFGPSCFEEDARRQAWIPADQTGSFHRREFALLARVSSHESLDVVQARVDAYSMRRAADTGRASYFGMFFQALDLYREQRARPSLLVLQSLAACLLLIACANVGSLLLLDASRRDAEFLTRAFLGASPSRIVRQLLLESTVVAFIGGVAGAAFSFIAGSAIRSLAAPLIPRGAVYHVRLGDAVLGVVAGVTASLIFAAVSAGIAARRARRANGRAETHGTSGRSVRRFQHGLVAIQAALSVVLAITTAVVGRSYLISAKSDLGLDPEGVVTSILYLPPDGSSPDRAIAAQESITAELRKQDSALNVAFSDAPPFAGGGNTRVSLDDRDSVVSRPRSSNITRVTPNYFEVLRIPIRRGRSLAAHPDAGIDEAVASASFADLYGMDIVGRIVRMARRDPIRAAFIEDPAAKPYRIVGIAADVKTTWIQQAPGPVLYFDLRTMEPKALSVEARTDNVAATTRLLPRVIATADPDAPEVIAESLASIIWKSEAERQFYVASAGTFALVAILIAGLGIYTAVRRMVALRTKEFAIRASLGAAPRVLQTNVLWTALMPVMVGIAGGVLSAWWLGGVAKSFRSVSTIISLVMHAVPDAAPTTIAVTVVALLLATIACWLPARRAASVDPAVLMKEN